MEWYALQTRSNFELTVERELQRRDVEAFYPSYEKRASSNNHRQATIRRPFFPGYVFANFNLDHRGPLYCVPQIVRIVGIGADPVAIPEAEIEGVRRVAALAPLVSARPADFYTEGQRVRVRQGPLQGVEGRVAYLKSAVRLVVSVEMLGQSVSAEVDAAWLEILGDR